MWGEKTGLLIGTAIWRFYRGLEWGYLSCQISITTWSISFSNLWWFLGNAWQICITEFYV